MNVSWGWSWENVCPKDSYRTGSNSRAEKDQGCYPNALKRLFPGAWWVGAEELPGGSPGAVVEVDRQGQSLRVVWVEKAFPRYWLPPAFRCWVEGREKLSLRERVNWDVSHRQSCRPSPAAPVPCGAALLWGLGETLLCSAVTLAHHLPLSSLRRAAGGGEETREPLLLQKQHSTEIFLQCAQ